MHDRDGVMGCTFAYEYGPIAPFFCTPMPHDTLMILRIQSHMSLLSRLGLIPCVFLGGLKVNPCSVPQASVMSSLRGYATREELLGRLRQAKAYELQEQSGPMHKSMWDDR